MKKTNFFLAVLLFAPFFLSAQTDITVQDDAKVGIIVTGTGNVINTTQIFGKSPEYAELKKRLDGLQAAITKKADECEQMRRDSLPAKYRDNCRAELIALNAERDSVQKIETRFRDDVIRLAETFSKIELNSRRLFLADSLFKEGKIREAETLLNYKEMKEEGDALLAKKERLDKLLRIKADEFALKAHLKARDYADPLRYDSAVFYFEQSLHYNTSLVNLWSFAALLYKDKKSDLAIRYYEKALGLARSESEEADLILNLGTVYGDVDSIPKAEEMYLRSYKIRERLAKKDPVQFEPGLASICMNLGIHYHTIGNLPEAEKMYLRSYDIRKRLVKGDSAQFKPDFAKICLNFGTLYYDLKKIPEAKKMFDRSLEIYERLAKRDPVKYEPELAPTYVNLSAYYNAIGNIPEAGNMCLRSTEIFERLVKKNPARFEPGLAMAYGNLSMYYLYPKNYSEAASVAKKSLSLDPSLNWVRANLGHSHLLRGDWDKAKAVYEEYLKNEPDPAAAKKALLKDWDDLEKAGVTHPDMEKARKWVRE